jgi:hypothetical protein
MRVLMISLFVAAAALTVIAGEENGALNALAVACFMGGVLLFFRWRRKLRASVFDREEKTSD